MEGLITFCMTSICFKREDYDFDDSFGEGIPDRDYSTMKPVLRYLQSILIKQEFELGDEDASEALMGIDQIMNCPEHL